MRKIVSYKHKPNKHLGRKTWNFSMNQSLEWIPAEYGDLLSYLDLGSKQFN